MANTTDLMITTFDDEKVAIDFINKATGLDFKLYTDSSKCGGTKVVIFEVYGTCPRCIGGDNIDKLIAAFKTAPFEDPQYAVLFIDDDNGAFTGKVLLDT